MHFFCLWLTWSDIQLWTPGTELAADTGLASTPLKTISNTIRNATTAIIASERLASCCTWLAAKAGSLTCIGRSIVVTASQGRSCIPLTLFNISFLCPLTYTLPAGLQSAGLARQVQLGCGRPTHLAPAKPGLGVRKALKRRGYIPTH